MKTFRSIVAGTNAAAWGIFGAVLLPVFSVLAQTPSPTGPLPPAPPVPSKADDPPAILSFLLTLVLIAGVIGANLIATKRGHQD